MGYRRPLFILPKLPARRRSAETRYARPHLEVLESREMLSALGLDIQLLRDDTTTTPGTPIPGEAFTSLHDLTHDSLNVGDFFWVQIVAWDQEFNSSALPSGRPGVISLPLNIAWDSTKIDFQGTAPVEPTPIDIVGNPILTPNFPQQRFLKDKNLAAQTPAGLNGFVNPPVNFNLLGLRAGAIPAAPGGGTAIGTTVADGTVDNATAWFSRLRFQAKAVVDQTPFVMQLAGSMSFADAAQLEGVTHVTAAGANNTFTFAPADDLNRITEFIKITGVESPISLSGFVFIDPNLNASFDRDANGVPIEMGLPGVTITLTGGPTPASTTTGPDGAYHFEGLAPGTYTVTETQPANFVDSGSELGRVLSANVVVGSPVGFNQFTGIVLNATDQHTGIDYNFGENVIPDKRFFFASRNVRTLTAERAGLSPVTINTTGPVTVTADANTITITDSTTHSVSIAQNHLVFLNANGGNVTFNGTDGDDTLDATPASPVVPSANSVTAAFRRGNDYSGVNFGIVVTGASSVTGNAGAGSGKDVAVLRAVPGTPDTLSATATTATLSNAQGQVIAIGFDTVRAVTLEDSDTATGTLSPGTLTLARSRKAGT